MWAKIRNFCEYLIFFTGLLTILGVPSYFLFFYAADCQKATSVAFLEPNNYQVKILSVRERNTYVVEGVVTKERKWVASNNNIFPLITETWTIEINYIGHMYFKEMVK
jgi:hypothetical protein